MEIAYVIITGVFTILGGISGVFMSEIMGNRRQKKELLLSACEEFLSAVMVFVHNKTPGNQNLLCVTFAKAALVAPKEIDSTIREITSCVLENPVDTNKLSTQMSILIEQSKQEFKYK